MRKRVILLFLFILLSFSRLIHAVEPKDVVTLTPLYETDKVAAGEEFRVALRMEILSGWHINSNNPPNEFTIPTKVILKDVKGIKIREIQYPEGKILELPSVGKSEFFEGTSYIIIKGLVDNSLRPGNYTMNGELTYQACNEKVCLPPYTKTFTLKLRIAPAGSKVRYLNPEIFGSKSEVALAEAEPQKKGFLGIEQKGLLLTFLLIFISGLALNLTPCVYPLIPITISYFGGMQVNRRRCFLNALLYVIGISITYSALGTFSALSGEMMGTQLTNPIVSVIIASIMVILSLSMFGLYEIRIPQSLMRLIGGEAKTGFVGSFLMGTTMGIVAAPCIGPFIVGLLAYVAALGDPVKGFFIFFTLSMGLGLPYLILAIFANRISSLPRSGEWMIGVRKIFGIVLVIMAVYFLDPVLSKGLYSLLFSGALVLGGAWLIIFEKSEKTRVFHIIKSVVAIAMIVLGVWTYRSVAKNTAKINWKMYSEEIIESAKREKRPVLLDFYADWCVPCKELDMLTFSDERVVGYQSKVLFVKVDLTQSKDKRIERIKKKYDIKGVPTIVFINKEGKEMRQLRAIGFINADEMIKRLERLTGG